MAELLASRQAHLVATLWLSDPEFRDQLIEDLRSRPEFIAAPISENAIEVDMVGSYSIDAMRLAIHLRVRVWEAAQQSAGRAIRVEVTY